MQLFKSRKKNVCFEIWQQPILPILVSNPFHAWGREASRPARRMGPACRTWPGGAACKFDRQTVPVCFCFCFCFSSDARRVSLRSVVGRQSRFLVFSQPQVVTRAEGRPLSLPPFVSLWSRLCPWTAPPTPAPATLSSLLLVPRVGRPRLAVTQAPLWALRASEYHSPHPPAPGPL